MSVRQTAEELAYRVRWRAGDVHAGVHRSRVDGPGEEFRGIRPLTQGRDARRIDLRASIRDPWERPWVRDFRQRSRIAVTLLADLSRSMRFTGRTERLGMVSRFAAALAEGAARRGDPFGFIGCDRTVRRDLLMPPMRSRQGGAIVARRLEALRREVGGAYAAGQGQPRDGGAEGLADAARWLPRQRSIVFLLSDLYLDPVVFERVLNSLVQHDLVVVMLADSAEARPPVRWGLVRLADLETGREQLVFLRPGMAERMAAGQHARMLAAARTVRRHGASMVWAQDALDFDAMAQHFLSRGGT